MRIIGIDPGTRVAGYGIVDVADGGVISGVAAGVWKLDSKSHLSVRLGQLSVEFSRVVQAYRPQQICLELAFVADNPKSALNLGHARGVILSQASLIGLKVFEMSPTAAKKCVTNYGRADKEQVALALESLLGVEFHGVPLDATDALALAYAQAMDYSTSALLASSGRALSAYQALNTRANKRKDFSCLISGIKK